jgi:hypothetical protein
VAEAAQVLLAQLHLALRQVAQAAQVLRSLLQDHLLPTPAAVAAVKIAQQVDQVAAAQAAQLQETALLELLIVAVAAVVVRV